MNIYIIINIDSLISIYYDNTNITRRSNYPIT